MEKHQYSLGYSMVENLQIEMPDKQIIGKPKVVTVYDESSKRMISKVEFVPDDPETRYDGLTVDDFALENLLANGYQPHLMPSSQDNSLSAIDSAAEKLHEFVEQKND